MYPILGALSRTHNPYLAQRLPQVDVSTPRPVISETKQVISAGDRMPTSEREAILHFALASSGPTMAKHLMYSSNNEPLAQAVIVSYAAPALARNTFIDSEKEAGEPCFVTAA